MNNEQVISYQDAASEKKAHAQNLRKILTGVAISIFLVSLSGISYFLGIQSGKKATPQPAISPTPTLSLFVNNPPSPTPKISPSPTILTSTQTPTPNPKSRIIESTPDLDGFVTSNAKNFSTAEIKVGRNSDFVARGFISFDISDLPDGAKITSAYLRLYQAKTTGNPYNVGGALKIDHLTYGNSLDADDYSTSALTSNLITLSNNTSSEWKEVDVVKALKDDLANARSSSQFRIHFVEENTGGDSSGDFAYFDSADSYPEHTGHNPQLVVKFTR